MVRSYLAGTTRLVGVVYGIVSTAGGVAVFVLFGGIPVDLLSLLPPVLARAVLEFAPWLVATGAGQASGAPILVISLVALAFLTFGLWSLGRVLFVSADSLGAGVGRD